MASFLLDRALSLCKESLRSKLGYWLIGTVGTGLLAVILRYSRRKTDNSLHFKDTERNRRLLSLMPSCRHFAAPLLLPGPHLNTFYGTILRQDLHMKYQRYMLQLTRPPITPSSISRASWEEEHVQQTDVEGHIALDWLHAPRRGQPVVIFLHGLTGGSQERYIQHAVRAAAAAGLAPVVMNARGCAGTQMLTPKCFSGAWTEDMRQTVRHIRSLIGPGVPLFAVGYSLGAGILSKYVCEEGLAEERRRARAAEGPAAERAALSEGLTAAISCCASFSFTASTLLLEQPVNRLIYNRVLTRALRGYLSKHQHHYQHVEWMKVQEALSAKSIREFDTATVVPMFGFRDVWHYYEDASSGRLLQHVSIPLLALNARDDPICAVQGLLDVLPKVHENENVIAVITEEGGHVAWCQSATNYATFPAAATAATPAPSDAARGEGPRTAAAASLPSSTALPLPAAGNRAGLWPAGMESWDNRVMVEFFQAILQEKNYIWGPAAAAAATAQGHVIRLPLLAHAVGRDDEEEEAEEERLHEEQLLLQQAERKKQTQQSHESEGGRRRAGSAAAGRAGAGSEGGAGADAAAGAAGSHDSCMEGMDHDRASKE